MNMTVNVSIPVIVTKEEDVFVSECPLLNVVSQGCTKEEAKDNLVEAVGLFLGTCIEMGTFSQVLKECGFVPAHKAIEDTDNNFDHLQVHLPFIASKELSECHA